MASESDRDAASRLITTYVDVMIGDYDPIKVEFGHNPGKKVIAMIGPNQSTKIYFMTRRVLDDMIAKLTEARDRWAIAEGDKPYTTMRGTLE